MNNAKPNVLLLIEDTVGSKIWKEEVEELKEKLINNSNFRKVEVNTFTKDENAKLIVYDENNRPVDPLIQNNHHNNLVFVLSDVCSKIWYNNQVYDLLNNLQSSSLVSVINVLPGNKWRGLAIDTDSGIKTTLPSEIQNNQQIICELPRYTTKEDLEDLLILPTTKIYNVDELLNSIMNGGKVSNACLYKNDPTLEIVDSIPLSAEKQVNSYISRSFQPACELAVYFSHIPSFTISDIEFVRQHMLPDTDKTTTAEFLLGGIADKINPLEESNPRNSDEIKYKIKEDIAEILKNSLTPIHKHAVQVLLKEKASHDVSEKPNVKMKI